MPRTSATRRLLDALAGPHGLDRYVELVRPTFSSSEVRAEVVRAERRTARSVTLLLRPNANWRGFRAGQFVNLSVEIDGVRHQRCYSPASSQHRTDGLLELTVTEHPQGLVSRHLRRRAHTGMVVGLSQAEGDFVLPERRPNHLLLISGGSGITPVLSMLRTLRDERHEGEVTFLHYVRTRADLLYADELEAAGAIVIPTRESDGGHFSPDHLTKRGLSLFSQEVFVCGPTSLIDAVRGAWEERGLEARLHVEHFVPPAPAPAPDAQAGTLTFARSGITAQGDGRPLLEQAEAAGLNPVHGCRMGICHTCTCRKTSGHVLDLRTGEVLGEDATDIRICVSAPVGDVAIDL